MFWFCGGINWGRSSIRGQFHQIKMVTAGGATALIHDANDEKQLTDGIGTPSVSFKMSKNAGKYQ